GESSWFDHGGATGSERGRNFPCRHRQWKVPRGDEVAGPHWQVGHNHGPVAFGVVAVVTLDPYGLFREPAEEFRAVVDFSASLGDGFSHFHRHEESELFPPFNEKVECPTQDV